MLCLIFGNIISCKFVKHIGQSDYEERIQSLDRGQTAKWPHGSVVGSALVPSELDTKIIQAVEQMCIVEKFLVFAVSVLYLAVMP